MTTEPCDRVIRPRSRSESPARSRLSPACGTSAACAFSYDSASDEDEQAVWSLLRPAVAEPREEGAIVGGESVEGQTSSDWARLAIATCSRIRNALTPGQLPTHHGAPACVRERSQAAHYTLDALRTHRSEPRDRRLLHRVRRGPAGPVLTIALRRRHRFLDLRYCVGEYEWPWRDRRSRTMAPAPQRTRHDASSALLVVW